MGALFGLRLETLVLVDGVVELGEGVAHLAAADEHLIALGERGLLGAALGQRADLTGYMVMNVGWMSVSSTFWSKVS